MLNEHFAAVLVNSESTKRQELQASWRSSVDQLRLERSRALVCLSLTQHMSSLGVVGSSATCGQQDTANGSSPLASRGLLNRLERVASASSAQRHAAKGIVVSSSQQQQHQRQGVALAASSSSASALRVGMPLISHDDDDEHQQHQVPKKRFNKVHSMRMMVSGSPDQQAARQLHEAEKQLRTFINSSSPRLPK